MWKRILLSGMLAASMALRVSGAADAWFESAGVRIHYVDQGQGVPVVLLHGFAGSFERHWVKTGAMGELPGKYRVIGLDFRGHGESGKPHDPKQYGAAIAGDVIRLLDHLKIPKAHIAGYSMGGRVATYLIAERPDRLLSAMVGGGGPAGPNLEARRKTMTEVAESFEAGKGAGPLLLSLWPPDHPPLTPDQIEAVNKVMLAANDPLALAAVARRAMDLDPSDARLRTCKLPVLIMVGEKDPRRQEAEWLKSLIPKAEFVAIPGASHMNAFSRPQFREKLQDFLARQN